MSDGQLTARHARPGPSRAVLLRTVLLRITVLLVVGVVVGCLAGLVWQWVWTPPTGAAWEGEFYLDPVGVTREVSGTGWYTVVGLLAGITFGTVAAYRSSDHEVATLVGVLLGGLLLAWTMLVVGHVVGPPDPHVVASTAGDWEPIVSDLRLAGVDDVFVPFGSSALLVPGVGALLGLMGIFFGGAGRRRPDAAAGGADLPVDSVG